MSKLGAEVLNDLMSYSEGSAAAQPLELPTWSRTPPVSAHADIREAKENWWIASATEYAEKKATGHRIRAVLWWVMTLSLVLNAVLGASLAHTALSVKMVPYVVQVDEHGYAVPIKPLDESDFESPLVQNGIKRDLRNWIFWWRSVTLESKTQKTFVDAVFAMTPKKSLAHDQITEWYGEHWPFETQGRTVEVEVHTVIPRTDAAYLVEWTEHERLLTASAKSTHFSALVMVEFSPVSTFEDIQVNAFGIYVTDVRFQQENTAQ